MAPHTDHIFVHWNRRPGYLVTLVFFIYVLFGVHSLAGTPCTEDTHTCDVATQFCNETDDAPGFLCTCINETQQLSPQNKCIPIPDSQKLYLAVPLSLASTITRWKDINTPQARKEAILTNFYIDSLKTGTIIDLVSISKDQTLGQFVVLSVLVFSVNVTSRIKEAVALRVLELEARHAVTFRGENVTILEYIGIFDTEQQMRNTNVTNDAIDWCSSPDLFFCRNYSTCSDYGLRYTCPCNVGYYDNNTECHLAVRLANSSDGWEGRLEYHPEARAGWRTVCQQGFTIHNSQVVCRQLGLPSRGAEFFENAVYGQGTGDVYMYQMNCTGDELALSQCPTHSLPYGSCDHGMDVGITCDTECIDDYHYGVNCSQPCQCNMSNTETCDRLNGTCYCKAGWEGVTCNDDVDDCAQTNSCTGELEQCQNTAGGFKCVCVDSAERNAVGACSAPTNSTPSPITALFPDVTLISAASSAGGVVTTTVVIIVIVVWKRRATTYSKPGKNGVGHQDHSDLVETNREADLHNEAEIYDEISDEPSYSDTGGSNGGYTRPHSVSTENLETAKDAESGMWDSNQRYLSKVGLDTKETTISEAREKPDLPRRNLAETAVKVNEHATDKSSKYLHPVYVWTNQPGEESEAKDSGYLHAVNAHLDQMDSGYLHAVNAHLDQMDSGYLHAVNAHLDQMDSGYLHAVNAHLDQMDSGYLHAVNVHLDQMDSGYLHAVNAHLDQMDSGYLHAVNAHLDQMNSGYLHAVNAHLDQMDSGYLHAVNTHLDQMNNDSGYSHSITELSEQSGTASQDNDEGNVQAITAPVDHTASTSHSEGSGYLHPIPVQSSDADDVVHTNNGCLNPISVQ